ncbi:MAG: FHA domain-containing protein [Candidatus Hydrogenedentota bacterium]|nr:MAG: FHA domain-containing protein [Candidatus Hydrogenedentota bacterium]
MPFLRFESGHDKGAVRPIQGGRVSIGRSPDNDIVVQDNTVSSHHAVISYLNQAYFIEDSGSVNGTYVNGVRVRRKRLQTKDKILLGETRLRYFDSPIPQEAEEFPVKRRDSGEILSQFAPRTPSPENMQALRQAHENLKQVYEITNIISSIFDIKQLAEKMLDIIFPLLDADCGYIMLVDKESAEPRPIAMKKGKGRAEIPSEMAFSRTIARQALEREESLMTSNAPEDGRFPRKKSIVEGQIRSAMCVPIRGRKEKLGVIYVDQRGRTGHFSDENLEFLTMVANSAGIAIENIRLYEENLKMNVLKAVNEEMRETNRRLMELESLKEDLINMIVHDMKNPVSNTLMGLDMIAFDPDGQLNEQQSEHLQMAKRNQFRLSEMIANLLEISKLESGAIQISKTSLDAPHLIDRVVERYAATAKKEEKNIHVTVDPGARRIVSDEGLLERILSNILSNAIKHSYPKGEILLSVVPAAKHEGVSFSVKDLGEGIPKKFHKEIFEKFRQAGLRELGHQTDTGLGLAFCKMAVEALGGSIWVESEPGKGSCFTFSLPGALTTE